MPFHPLYRYEATNYFRAFLISSLVTSIVFIMSIEVHKMLDDFHVKSRVALGVCIAFSINFGALTILRGVLGTGGGMLTDEAGPNDSFWTPR